MPNAMPPAGVLARALGSALKGRFTRLPPVARPVAADTGSNEASERFGFEGVMPLVPMPVRVVSVDWKP